MKEKGNLLLFLKDTEKLLPVLEIIAKCDSVDALNCLKESIDLRIKDIN